jgi:hypothetical protein
VLLLVLAVHGSPTAEHVQALELGAPDIIGGHGSVFVYLGDSVSASVGRVLDRPHPELSIAVGLLLLALLIAAFRQWFRYLADLGRWLLPTRRSRATWCAVTCGLTGTLFALGFDWLRWITVIGFAALLAVAAVVLVEGRARHPSPTRDAWHRSVPTHVAVSARSATAVAIATYLLVLPPLPNFVSDPLTAARLLLDVPR